MFQWIIHDPDNVLAGSAEFQTGSEWVSLSEVCLLLL